MKCKKVFFGIVMLSVMFIAGCNKEDSFRSNSTESNAEQLLMLLNGTQSQENFEKFKSLIGKVSESDVKEFSKLQVADELSKMQERGGISSYSEDDVNYLSQKQFECYQELYKVTGKRSPLQLTSEELDIVLRDENVHQLLYEIKSYSESLRPQVEFATTRAGGCSTYYYGINTSQASAQVWGGSSCSGYYSATNLVDSDCDYEFAFSCSNANSCPSSVAIRYKTWSAEQIANMGGIQGRLSGTTSFRILIGSFRIALLYPSAGPSGLQNDLYLNPWWGYNLV